jgi:uncharacterized integral membrane protein
MKHLKVIVASIFVFFVIVIAVQNYDAFSTSASFKLDLLFFKYETSQMSLYLIAVITFLIGVVFTGFFTLTERLRLKREIKRLKKEARDREKELNSFRTLPVTADGEAIEGGRG